MSDGNQGPAWWFAWVGHTNTNLGMARFLAVPVSFVVILGLVAWSIWP
jgi:hypothetical protein